MRLRIKYTLLGTLWLILPSVALALALAVIFTGCTPQSQRPFEPTKQVSVAEEQRKSIVPGEGAPYSGMDCLKQVEYQIAYCEATMSCTAMQYRRLKRAARRLDKGFRSQCLYSESHIREVYRHMQRGRQHRALGR